MSTFMVNDITFNSVAKTLIRRGRRSGNYRDVEAIISKFDDTNDTGMTTEQRVEAFIYTLKNCNAQAVDARYGDLPDGTPVEWQKGREMSNLCLVKQLQCIRYQMTEGEIPRGPVYKELKELLQGISEHIVSRSDKYEQYPWELETDETIKQRINNQMKKATAGVQ